MGHPVLRARAQPLEPAEVKNPRVQQLIDDLFETMLEYRGVGLAAPQVHANVRLFVAGMEGDDEGLPPMTLINPEIVAIGGETAEDWEGCLSIPDVRGRVPRHVHIEARGLDRDGKRVVMRLSDFAARVVQHEADHLDGVLFLDRMKSFESLTFLEEHARFWSRPEVVHEERPE